MPNAMAVSSCYCFSRSHAESISSAIVDDPTPTQEPSSSSAIILRDQESTVSTLRDSAAGEFLQSRTFRGLETRAGLDFPSLLVQGRSGIARGYGDDH
jgi:diphthamide biosynthesis protein 2